MIILWVDGILDSILEKNTPGKYLLILFIFVFVIFEGKSRLLLLLLLLLIAA